MTQWGKTFPLSVIAVLATGCADGPMLVSSTQADLSKPIQGIPYYLPLGVVPVTISASSGRSQSNASDAAGSDTYKVSVNLGAVRYTADSSQQYFLTYTQNQFADDHMEIHVGPNGLLQTSKGQSTDRSAASAAKLVELLGEIAKLPYALPSRSPSYYAMDGGDNRGKKMPPTATKPVCSLPTYTTDLLLVPRAATGGDAISVKVHAAGNDRAGDWQAARVNFVTVLLEDKQGHSVRVSVMAKPDTPATLNPAGSPPTNTGVLFRGLRGYSLTTAIEPQANTATDCNIQPYYGVQQVMLPNDGTVFAEDTSRAALVHKQLTLTIQDGMLTGVEVDKPSEFLAGVSLPTDVLKSLLAIPTGVLTFRVQQLQAEKGLSEAEASALQEQIDLIKKRAEYGDATKY